MHSMKHYFKYFTLILTFFVTILSLSACYVHKEMDGTYIAFQQYNDGSYSLYKGVDQVEVDGKVYSTIPDSWGTINYSKKEFIPDKKSKKPFTYEYNEKSKVLQLGKGDSKSLYVKKGSKKYSYILKHLQ